MFLTNYNCHDPERIREPEGRVFDFEPSVTEQAGWLPVSKQVERLLVAGENLADFRRAVYDFSGEKEVPVDFVDPTRSPGFDLADASEVHDAAMERLKAQAQAAKAAAAESGTASAGGATEVSSESGDGEATE